MLMIDMSDRLRWARRRAGFTSAREASVALNVGYSTYNGHENGQNNFKGAAAEKYARRFKVSAAWLLTGEPTLVPSDFNVEDIPTRGDRTRRPIGMRAPVGEEDGYFEGHYRPKSPGGIPELDVSAGAGEGKVGDIVQIRIGNETFSGHRVIDEWSFPDSYLRNTLKLQSNQTMIVSVTGDSMAPTLRHGDKIFIDLRVKGLGEDGMYLITDGNSPPRVKRLEYIFRSEPPAVKIISDNPAHGEQEAPLSETHIVGRVAGRVTAE